MNNRRRKLLSLQENSSTHICFTLKHLKSLQHSQRQLKTFSNCKHCPMKLLKYRKSFDWTWKRSSIKKWPRSRKNEYKSYLTNWTTLGPSIHRDRNSIKLRTNLSSGRKEVILLNLPHLERINHNNGCKQATPTQPFSQHLRFN